MSLPRWLLLFALTTACTRDEGPDRLARAQAKYDALVEQGIPPRDPAWDPVLADLESIPPESKARAEAQRRLSRLKELRTTALPRRPLSRTDEPDGGPPSLDEHGH